MAGLEPAIPGRILGICCSGWAGQARPWWIQGETWIISIQKSDR